MYQQHHEGQCYAVQGDGCGVWQHDTCVGIGEAQSLPRAFHCELCRAALADPFWVCRCSSVNSPRTNSSGDSHMFTLTFMLTVQ